MNINRICILGDSFSAHGSSAEGNPSGKEKFWIKDLNETYPTLVYAEPSRDVQTILDTWTKLLPKVEENDFLIVGFPYFSRYRFPLNEMFYRKEPHLHCKINYHSVDVEENELITRHVGQHGEFDIQNGELEFYNKDTNRQQLLEKLDDNQIINSSFASALNNKELIESLTQVSKCRTLLWSWTRFKKGFKPEGLYDKTDLEKELGHWGTLDDIYRKSSGKFGFMGDLHWDEKTHDLFAKFVQNKIEE